jgi:hypothetical protein
MSIGAPSLRGTVPLRVTVEECRIQANHCLQESRKVFGSPGICAAWLKLAEHWLNIADRL